MIIGFPQKIWITIALIGVVSSAYADQYSIFPADTTVGTYQASVTHPYLCLFKNGNADCLELIIPITFPTFAPFNVLALFNHIAREVQKS